MRCRKARTLLPLFVGSDLFPDEEARVAEHLRGCATCRELEARHRRSLELVKEGVLDPPFDERDYVAVRRAVRQSLETAPAGLGSRERLAGFFEGRKIAALLLAAALALAAGLAVSLLHSKKSSRAPGAEPMTVAERAVPKAAESVGSPAPSAIPHSTGPAPVARRGRPRHIAATASSAIAAVSRIEMQTSDPNIRIIWFLRAPDGT